MTDRPHRRLLAAATALFAIPAAAEAPPAPSLPPEVAAHVPADLRSYYIAFMVNPPEPKDMPHELFVRHQAYIRQKIDAGVFHLAGPLTDQGRIRGILVLSAPSLEEAHRIAGADPAVREGVLAIEVHPAILPNLGTLKVAYPPSER